MEPRFVLYSEELGVYLGKDGANGGHNWSKSNPGLKSSAPTYTMEEARAKIAALVLGHGKQEVFICHAKPVAPDFPPALPSRASQKACVASGFEPWFKEDSRE